MPELVRLPNYLDNRGRLTILEDLYFFPFKRVYFITEPKGVRGGHRHKKTKQALICVNGSCSIIWERKNERKKYVLDSPEVCLILNPEDWHTMQDFSVGCVLLVVASENYDKDDYIFDV